MASPLDPVITELEAYLVALEPILEGFQDYERLNLKPEAKVIATAGTAAYTTLRADVVAAIAALKKVVTRDYPALPTFVAEPTAKIDLTDNSRTIAAALRQVTAAPMAVKIAFSVSDEEPA